MSTHFEIPGTKAASAATRNPANPSQRILVVEDDAVTRQINARVLVRSGYQVDGAEDGAAGWEALQLLEAVRRVLRAAGCGSFGPEICSPLLADALGESTPY